MNFLSIFKLLQIRLPFTETVFYVPMSTFLPYPITCQLQIAPPGAPLDACVSRRACRQGRGPLQPLVRSRPADHHQQKPECLAFQKSLLLTPHPAPPPPPRALFFWWENVGTITAVSSHSRLCLPFSQPQPFHTAQSCCQHPPRASPVSDTSRPCAQCSWSSPHA